MPLFICCSIDEHMVEIRDPVHGYVKIDGLCLSLLDTPQFQRLRWIRQLGLASLVYPGASHSRFEHSLGSYHLAVILSDRLGLSDDDAMRIRAAALLHDIGHGPLSHVTEPMLSKYLRRRHESILDLLRSEDIRTRLEHYGITPEEIQKLIKGRTELGKIVSGEIDVDRMDYLIRDAHYTGVAYGVFDHLRLIERMHLSSGRLMIDSGGVHAAESLLLSRLLMQPTVYQHHVCRISECMVAGALRYMIDDLGFDPSSILRMDDFELFGAMGSAGGYASEIAERIKTRRLFKRALYVGAESLEFIPKPGSERMLAEEISSDSGVDQRYVLVDSPPAPEVPEGSFPVMINTEVMQLREVSPVARILEDAHRATWRLGVYTLPEHRERVARAAERCLGVRKPPRQHTLDSL